MENHVAWFYTTPCKIEKYVQEDKKQVQDNVQWGVI